MTGPARIGRQEADDGGERGDPEGGPDRSLPACARVPDEVRQEDQSDGLGEDRQHLSDLHRDRVETEIRRAEFAPEQEDVAAESNEGEQRDQVRLRRIPEADEQQFDARWQRQRGVAPDQQACSDARSDPHRHGDSDEPGRAESDQPGRDERRQQHGAGPELERR